MMKQIFPDMKCATAYVRSIRCVINKDIERKNNNLGTTIKIHRWFYLVLIFLYVNLARLLIQNNNIYELTVKLCNELHSFEPHIVTQLP